MGHKPIRDAKVEAFLIKSHSTLKVAAQAARTGLSINRIKHLRSLLLAEGRISIDKRATHRPWTALRLDRAEELIADGATLAYAAQKVGATADELHTALKRAGRRTPTCLRDTEIAPRSARQVCALFGVGDYAVRVWEREGWLERSPLQVEGQSTHRYTYEALLAFVAVRNAWPMYRIKNIADPIWREIAQEAREAAGGQWVTAALLADQRYVARTTMGHWLRTGAWPVEHIRYGRTFCVWMPDSGELPPLPSALPRRSPKTKDRSYAVTRQCERPGCAKTYTTHSLSRADKQRYCSMDCSNADRTRRSAQGWGTRRAQRQQAQQINMKEV